MGQTLETLILINAKMGSGFSQIGSTLRNLGNMINQISQPLMDFGKESLNVYREYEASLADAEVALSTTYGQNSAQLKRVMADLDDAATEWAASTIFHTNDVGNAISEMAHAGWDYDQIISGMPAAMKLAQAGSLDLSETVDYIVKSTNAAGLEFEGLGGFIDDWTYSANSSATTIGEMGDAMLRMGRTMQFAGGQEELLTMLATLADAGTVGSDAGTLLRNSMLRLVAPTEKASGVMEELGFTAEEMESVLDDTSLVAAADALERVGFSAYDVKTGELKDMPTIFHDLGEALNEIPTEEERNSILSSIFPTRSITGAMALLEGAKDNWGGLLTELKDGTSTGYGDYASARMMDTLNGSIEIFESKVERLKQVVGGELAEDVRAFLTPMGEFVDSVAGMDEGSFGALVGALESIALAGPGLLIAGGAISYMSKFGGTLEKMFGSLMSGSFGASLGSLAGWSVLAAIALGTLKKAMDEIYEEDYASKFGELSFDGTQISAFADKIKKTYENQLGDIKALGEEYDAAVKTFSDTSGNLVSELVSKQITGNLDIEDEKKFIQMGNEIYAALDKGINAAHEEQGAMLTKALGDEYGENGGVFTQLMNIVSEDLDKDIDAAEALGKQLSDAITRGFAEGFTPENLASVREAMQGMSDLLAAQRTAENNKRVGEALFKAQNFGLDSFMESVETISQANQEEAAAYSGELYAKYKEIEAAYNEKIANGELVDEIYTDEATAQKYGKHAGDVTGEQVVANAEQRDFALGVLDRERQELLDDLALTGNTSLLDAFDYALSGNGLSEAYKKAQEIGAGLRETGMLSETGMRELSKMGWDSDQLRGTMNWWMERMGGADKMDGYIAALERKGDTATAARYQAALDTYNVVNAPEGEEARYYRPVGDYSESGNTLASFQTALEGFGYTKDILTSMVKGNANFATEFDPGVYTQLSGTAAQFGETVESAITKIVNAEQGTGASLEAETTAGTKTQAPDIGPVPLEYELVGEPEVPDDLTVEANVAFNETEVPEVTEPVTITPKVEGIDAQEALTSQGVDVQVNGDTSSLTATIEAENGKELLEYVNGDASNLQASITAQDNRHVTTYVSGNTASLAAAINAYNGRTITVNIVGRRMFASGGRATEASIFGEAGPEWAIPEEHSERTAQLLNAAREASGFSWPELLARFGGFNANPANTPATVVYSPTINAADVTGVDSALREDKSRLERWFRERQMLDGMEVYA